MAIPEKPVPNLTSEVKGKFQESSAEDALLQKSSSGRSYSRLRIEGLDYSKFGIRIMSKFEQWFLTTIMRSPNKCVSLRVSGSKDPIIINVGSLCKRLLLTENQVHTAAKKGELEQLIQERASELSASHQILENYEFLPETEEAKLAEKQLRDRSGKISVFTLPALFKIGKEIRQLEAHLKDDEIMTERRIDGHRFQVVKKEGKVNLLSSESAEKLAKGAFGTVIKIYNVTQGAFQVLKSALYQKNSESEAAAISLKGLFNEVAALKDIHKNGIIEGIQAPPYLVTEPNGNKGYLAKFYHGTAEKWVEDKRPSEVLLMCQKLMKAFSAFSRCHYWHKDIKPLNILMTEQGDPVLADFGGAKKLSLPSENATAKDFEDINGFGMTGLYCHGGTLNESEQLAEQGKKALGIVNNPSSNTDAKSRAQIQANELRNQINRMARFQDFYATLGSMYVLMNGSSMSQISRNGEKQAEQQLCSHIQAIINKELNLMNKTPNIGDLDPEIINTFQEAFLKLSTSPEDYSP